MEQKISNFYVISNYNYDKIQFSQQNSDCNSDSYKIILDKLLAIWKKEDDVIFIIMT